MNAVDIAWRNVVRNRRRSALTLLALAVGSMAILLFAGYVRDNEQGLETITVRSHGHLQVVRRDYLDFGRGDPGRFSIRGYEALMNQIALDPALAPLLAVVTPTLHVEGVAGNFSAGVSSNFVGEGVVPSDYRALLSWDGFRSGIPPGESALAEERTESGVIGFRLAQSLALCAALRLEDCKLLPPPPEQLGTGALPPDLASIAHLQEVPREEQVRDTRPLIDLLAASAGGLPNVVRMSVAKSERQAIREIDSMYVAMPLRLAQRLVFGPDERAASAIVVQLKHSDMLPAAQRRLDELVQGSRESLQVLNFHETSPVFDQIVASYESVFQFIAVLMAVIALFSVANAVHMAVGERKVEIGTLRALGFQRGSIRSVFVLEGAMLGLLGASAGAAAAMAAAIAINRSHLSWTPPGRSHAIPLRVEMFGSPWIIAAAILGLSLVACLSALWPANAAARMEVTEALRHG